MCVSLDILAREWELFHFFLFELVSIVCKIHELSKSLVRDHQNRQGSTLEGRRPRFPVRSDSVPSSYLLTYFYSILVVT
jgi:hypothetical protein